MGSQKIQGELWGKRPEGWAIVQETTGRIGYDYVLKFLQLKPGSRLLDVGCGSGLFCSLAHQAGIDTTGMDARDHLIAQARARNAAIPFLVGEMEELPFEDGLFDVVCGFNSFQYAASVPHAFAEARRVLK